MVFISILMTKFKIGCKNWDLLVRNSEIVNNFDVIKCIICLAIGKMERIGMVSGQMASSAAEVSPWVFIGLLGFRSRQGASD